MGAVLAKKGVIFVGGVFVILAYLPLLFLSKEVIASLTVEDGFYESLTALLFFFASVILFYNFFKAKKRNFFFLLFALAFFFAAGEEISWGQRILHFSTPAAMETANAQKEFNIHNLTAIQHEHGLTGTIKSLLNFNRLFIVFWVIYCALIPLAVRYFGKIRSLLEKLRLPIVPIWFGLLFLFNDVTAKAVELWAVSRFKNNLDVPEIKEALWALIVFLMAIYFLSTVLSPERKTITQVAHVPSD